MPALTPKFIIRTFNAISPKGLVRFSPATYTIQTKAENETAHAILLRSHKVQEGDVPLECRAIARCGAGTNNCNVDRMTELGIPVFNTPGANANAVKELVLCGLLLSSRKIVEGIDHMKKLHAEGTAHERIEKDKALFGGRELTGKTLGLIGLGAIGASVTKTALDLGMKVIGHDPALSVEGALRLPGEQVKMASMEEVVAQADYLSLHAPYMPSTKEFLNAELLRLMKPDASILNFARGELVDEDALAFQFESGASTGRYVCDFAVSDRLWKLPNVISLPHLGASTEEAEENAAAMAADTIKDFLETGAIVNSVNFPTTKLPVRAEQVNRLAVVTENRPGMLGELMTVFGANEINVLQQVNTSKGKIAYNVIDLELHRTSDGAAAMNTSGKEVPITEVQTAIMALKGVISSRFINDWSPGSGYAIKYNDKVIGVGDHRAAEKNYAELKQ
jgi:D-3-phosphoglycerate dehydrogenase